MIELSKRELLELYYFIIKNLPDRWANTYLDDIVQKIYELFPDKCNEVRFILEDDQGYIRIHGKENKHSVIKYALSTEKVVSWEWVESERMDKGYPPDKVKVVDKYS